MTNLTDFIQNELYPRLFEVVDRAFPSMDFKPYRGGWASPYKLNGERSHDGRKEKSTITRRVPHRVLEQGGENKDLLSFYMELNGFGEKQTAEAVNTVSAVYAGKRTRTSTSVAHQNLNLTCLPVPPYPQGNVLNRNALIIAPMKKKTRRRSLVGVLKDSISVAAQL